MIAIWLKDDLRLEDSPSFKAVLSDVGQIGDVSKLLVIMSDESPVGHVQHTRRRIVHDSEARQRITALIEQAGGKAVTVSGAEMTAALLKHDVAKLHANIQVGDNISFARDQAIHRYAKVRGITFTEHSIDGLSRGSKLRPANDGLFITGAKELDPVRFDKAPPAMANLRTYLDRLPRANYRRDMWTPGPDAKASSRLSIALASGTLSSDRVLYEAQNKASHAQNYAQRTYNDFCARINWRRCFLQMLENNVQAFPWGPVREERPEDASRMQAWLQGETGYPLVDAAMRDLTSTGWVNFRLRQVLLSFAVDLLDLDMHKAGVALGALFDDYSPGIHWCQVALQSGMIKGRGPRVINPTKQMAELDPVAAYAKRWLPWMTELPPAYLHEPWKWDNYKGPKPVVPYESAAREARARRA